MALNAAQSRILGRLGISVTRGGLRGRRRPLRQALIARLLRFHRTNARMRDLVADVFIHNHGSDDLLLGFLAAHVQARTQNKN